MKAFIIALFAVSIQAFAQGIPVRSVCDRPIWAAWGASRHEVMRSATQAGYTFASIEGDSTDYASIKHLQYNKGDKESVLFHFRANQFIAFTVIWSNYDPIQRKKWMSAQTETILLSSNNVNEKSDMTVDCDGASFQYSVKETKYQVWMQCINVGLVQKIARGE